MTRTALLAALLLAGQVISLPVTNPTTKDDAKVMNCIVEVISGIVSKPNPLPISQECLETLQGDERVLSILRHQNLLKELQEIAIQGASERTEQQKKSSSFEDELSEVLESQGNKNTERDLLEATPDEEPAASFAELEAEKSRKNLERDGSKEDERNSLEERESRARDVEPEDGKKAAGFDSSEVGQTKELPWDGAVDNNIHDDTREDEVPQQRRQEDGEAAEREEMDAVAEEKEHISKNSQGESNEEVEDSVRDQAEEEDENEEEEEVDEKGTSDEERPTSPEDKDDQREDDNQDADQDGKLSKEKEKFHGARGGRHHSRDEARQDENTSHSRHLESEEVEEDPSRGLEDSKRWNKMDELAKQLTTTKRTEENESDEDPDRSMKLALRSHNYDFRTSEDDMRRTQKHHSKEESIEGAFPLAAMPEEKKDEEGSANRRTEDQELESLAAIEAELEKVAHKLHALQRG
ncbi:chromogranin-A [Rhineura floridana]|uniref:chromogranin-A n=1 Tax=Rhineura floridana TaxID=261503 RepID=UPI002AC81FC0|nr:chromogranin-A [Rhineura floridana]